MMKPIDQNDKIIYFQTSTILSNKKKQEQESKEISLEFQASDLIDKHPKLSHHYKTILYFLDYTENIIRQALNGQILLNKIIYKKYNFYINEFLQKIHNIIQETEKEIEELLSLLHPVLQNKNISITDYNKIKIFMEFCKTFFSLLQEHKNIKINKANLFSALMEYNKVLYNLKIKLPQLCYDKFIVYQILYSYYKTENIIKYYKEFQTICQNFDS